MQIETYALVLRDKSDSDNVIDVIPLAGDNGMACVTYPNELIVSLDVLHEAIKGYNEETRRNFYFDYSEGKDICLEVEALYMPDIGNAGISVECKYVDWEYVPPDTQERYVVLPCVEDSDAHSISKVHSDMLKAVNPVRSVRRPVGNENAEFWGVYLNCDDGTQGWIQDFDDIPTAHEFARRKNGE